MQPLGYLAARLLVSCFQAFERHQRAFVGSGPVLLAAGVGHCWAVAYSLILALAMQAARLTGGRDYIDQLPFWVFKAEQLALLSGLVWWVASMALFLVRAVKLDDGSQGLPMNIQDAGVNWLVTLVQSPTVHRVLDMAHIVSCFGNFFSIVLLCSAIAWMGGASLHEACLTLVAFAFAVPHALLAAQRVASELQQRHHLKGHGAGGARGAPTSAESDVTLAVASEAAALGPQLTVVLACADATAEEVPFWQCATSVVAVTLYATSLIACGLAPPRRRGAVTPPSLSELSASLAVDVLAATTLVLSFFHLTSWQWWLLFVIFAILLASISWGPVRMLLVELVEPVMPLLDGGEKARPMAGPRRELSRQLARASVALCAAVALRSSWGRWAALPGRVATPPPPAWADYEERDNIGGVGSRSEYSGDNVVLDEDTWNDHRFDDFDDYHDHDWPYDDHDDYFADWSAEELLLLRWRDSHDGEAMGAAAEALGVDADDLIVRDSLPQHRLMLFEVRAKKRELLPENSSVAWRRISTAPPERLSALAEGFPPALNTSLCVQLSEREWDDTEISAADAELLSGALALTDRPVLLAYAGACAAWRGRPIYDHDELMGMHDFDDGLGHDYWGGMGLPDDGLGDGGGLPPEPAEGQGAEPGAPPGPAEGQAERGAEG